MLSTLTTPACVFMPSVGSNPNMGLESVRVQEDEVDIYKS